MKIKELLALGKRFFDKDLMHYASSLSYHTILAIVPILLIVSFIFTQMPNFNEYYEHIKSLIISSLLPSHEKIVSVYIEQFLQNTVQMGIMGFIVVIFVSMMFFKDYEHIINKIMHAEKRSFWQSMSAYWTLLTLAPICLVISFFLSNKIQFILNSSDFTNWINFVAIFPYLVIWSMFFTAYMISSSTKLSTKSGAIASFVASLAWYISKSLFVYYVMYNKSYLSIYGSFSVVLFFFIWIYFSWVVYLYGVRICYLLHIRDLKIIEKITDTDDEDDEHENSSVSRKNSEK